MHGQFINAHLLTFFATEAAALGYAGARQIRARTLGSSGQAWCDGYSSGSLQLKVSSEPIAGAERQTARRPNYKLNGESSQTKLSTFDQTIHSNETTIRRAENATHPSSLSLSFFLSPRVAKIGQSC